MGEISGEAYLATGAARISFGDSVPRGFVRLADVHEQDLRWQHRLGPGRVAALYVEHRLSRRVRHNIEDFFVACYNVLRPGGRLRVVEPDHAHPGQAYTSLIGRMPLLTPLDLPGLTQMLVSAGFAVRPIEFYDSRGRFATRRNELDVGGRPARSRHTDPRGDNPDIQYSSLIVDAVKPDPAAPLSHEPPIAAVGDSHTRFLAGRDTIAGSRPLGLGINVHQGSCARFVAYHLGAALAYRVLDTDGRAPIMPQIDFLFHHGHLPAGRQVAFSFGEIDCRVHVVRQAERQGRPIAEIANDVCDRYVAFLDLMTNRGLRPMVWAPIASTANENYPDPEMYGTVQQRNEAVRSFTVSLRRLCENRGYPVLSVSEALIGADGRTRREYYADSVHLSQRARPLLWQLMPE